MTLTVDSDLLFQALANIVDNAVKYTPEGGTIEIYMHQSVGHVDIHIVDNGIGVEPEDLPKLCRRFYRVEKSRSKQGNGLGLSLVAAAVALHRGTIELKSNHPGLRVELSLPC